MSIKEHLYVAAQAQSVRLVGCPCYMAADGEAGGETAPMQFASRLPHPISFSPPDMTEVADSTPSHADETTPALLGSEAAEDAGDIPRDVHEVPRVPAPEVNAASTREEIPAANPAR